MSVTGFVFFFLTTLETGAAQDRPFSHPPTAFSAEDATFPDAVPLTPCIRKALARDDDVLNVLSHENLTGEELPQSWFTASEQSLGKIGTYVVVMGAGIMRGANINPFWIFLQRANSCDLLLSLGAHDLEVLRTTTGAIPDLKIDAATAVRYFESVYKFDGHKYRLARTTSQPIGEDIPKDLSGFETISPLVQRVDQGPDSILTKARSWLWQRWRQEKESYLKVILRSKEGDTTTTTYFITKEGGNLQVMIQTHSIVVDRSGAGGPLIKDDLEIATNMERRLALKGNPARKTIIPQNEEAPPDTYELYLNDDGGNNVAVL